MQVPILHNYKFLKPQEVGGSELSRQGKHWLPFEEYFLIDNYLNLKDKISHQEILTILCKYHMRTHVALEHRLVHLNIISRNQPNTYG